MKKFPEKKPKWVAWEVTKKCNLQCIHCRSSSEISQTIKPFAFEQAVRLIDRLAEFCTPILVLTGGEPLLRQDIFQIAEYGTTKGFRISIATNGTLISNDVCVQLKRSGVKTVALSLDGSTAETHDNFRKQKGAFAGVCRAINHLKKHEIDFIINSSFAKSNQHDIFATFRLAKNTGAKAWYMFMCLPVGRGSDISSELIERQDYERILTWHFKQEQLEKDLLMRPTCAPQYFRLKAKNNMQQDTRREIFSNTLKKGCLAGNSICLIDSEGDVRPCSYFPLSAGNIFQESFSSIWRHSPLLRVMRNSNNYKGKCGRCKYFEFCGGCRVRAFVDSGDYLADEPMCSYVPKSSEHVAGLQGGS